MAEEVRDPGPLAEGSIWGLYEASDPIRWSLLAPNGGDVMIVQIPTPIAEEAGVYGAFVVVQRCLMSDGSLLVRAKSLGASHPDVTTKLSQLFNRRVGHIHCCASLLDCHATEDVAFHTRVVELQHGDQLEAPYVNSNGRKLLKQGVAKFWGSGRRPDPGDEAEGWVKLGEMAPPRGARAVCSLSGKGVGDKRPRPAADPPEPGGNAGLRERLTRLKEKEAAKKSRKENAGGTETTPQTGIFGGGGSQVPAGPQGPGPAKLGTGTHMHQLSPELQAMLKTSQAPNPAASAAPRGGISSGLSLSKVTGSVNGQLAMRAAAQAQEGGDGGGLNPSGGFPWGPPQKKKKKKKKKKKGKKKKKKRAKRPGGGGGPPSGSSSNSSSSSGASSSASESSKISSASEYLPPLKRRSERKPGSIMRLLLEQIEEQLAAVQGGGHENASLLTGTKVISYYHLLVRGNGVNSSSRDGREMYLIAMLLDMLRVGSLDRLGDGLSARFLALQQAQIDGHWGAARHFEIFTPDISTAAGPALTLEARRHARMMEKAKGQEYSKGRGSYGQGSWSSSKGSWNSSGGENASEAWKSKGKKGKGNKGKGNAWGKTQPGPEKGKEEETK